jgi:hypothetical protein
MEASFPPDHGKRKTNDKKTGGCNGEVALYIFFTRSERQETASELSNRNLKYKPISATATTTTVTKA